MAYVPPVNGVPPVNNTPPTGGPQGSCRTAGCRFEGHRDNGFMCSECSRGWTPQRLEQLRLLRKEAEADKRARYFVDWDEPGVTFAPHEYEQLRRAVESWAACPICHKQHAGRACVNRVFARASCPVCLEMSEPVVPLPCGHALCEPCFGRLPGADRAGKPDSFGMIAFVSNLLLESHRLLTPEQARGLWRAVEPTVLDVHDHVDGRARTKFIVLLASFLNSPERWCGIPWNVRQEFWPDEADGCYLGRLAPHKPGPRLLPTYDQMLRVRLEPLRESKLMAAACLRRMTLPKSVIRRIRIARGRPGPDIPPLLVKRIFLWLGPDQVRPREDCCWMVFRSEYDGSNQEWSQFLGNMRRRS